MILRSDPQDFWPVIEPLLAGVERPSRYIGGELGSISKETAEVRIALSYPDLYEIGVSNIGLSILYGILNQRDWLACERVYLPERDLENILRKNRLPLYTLETKTALSSLDLIGITLQYELVFTNILKLLDMGGIPLLSERRTDDDPIIFGGGPCAYNPEPVSRFFDAFFIGEAEEGFAEALAVLRNWKQQGKAGGRSGFLSEISSIRGIYVPSLYHESRQEDGKPAALTPIDGAPPRIEKQLLSSFAGRLAEVHPIVPFTEAVHDRAVVEIFRGCTRGCRFCQAGVIYRPVRERPMAEVMAAAADALAATGHGEISLASLCTSDYSQIKSLLAEVQSTYHGDLSLSLPSLRVDTFSVQLALLAGSGRKGGLTLAPEAGSQRMRDTINKGICEDDILSAARAAFESGWERLKLYFMIGLPGETREDVEAIAELSERILSVGREVKGKNWKRLTLVVNVSTFVPKSHTPFQWAPQLSTAEVEERQGMLKERLRSRAVQLRWHDSRLSELEGIFARGGRELGGLIQRAYELGCDFDAWNNRIRWDLWQQAIEDCGVVPEDYLAGRPLSQALPWDHISPGVDKVFLVDEYQRSLRGSPTGDCRWEDCTICGVCQAFSVGPDLANGE